MRFKSPIKSPPLNPRASSSSSLFKCKYVIIAFIVISVSFNFILVNCEDLSKSSRGAKSPEPERSRSPSPSEEPQEKQSSSGGGGVGPAADSIDKAKNLPKQTNMVDEDNNKEPDSEESVQTRKVSDDLPRQSLFDESFERSDNKRSEKEIDEDEGLLGKITNANKWSLEDKESSGESTTRKPSKPLSEEEMSETDRVVEAIKLRFGNPDVIQMVDPPQLEKSPGLGIAGAKKFKLVLNQQTMTPAEPITNLLNKRKEPEVPEDDELEVGSTPEEGQPPVAVDEKAAAMFSQAVELLGESAARDSTGYHVITSVGKTEKVEQAYTLLQQAALRGHKKAMEIVGWGQLLGPLPLDIEAARTKFEILGKKGYPNSQMALGFLHANALDTELNNALPILYYTFSSAAGASWSQMALGYRFWAGIGVQASCEKALEQYRRVAATVASEVSEVGTGPAIQRIRLLDEIEGTGGGGSSSSSGANGNVLNSDILDYYTMLAERGDLQAQVGLGQLHFQGGRGISPDHHLALRYFQRAADSGSAVAMAFLGKMYLEGNDAVQADTTQALRWFQKAAEQGSPVGQSGLGLMYLQGKGLPKDPSKALQYFTMAAEQGWVDGQLHLGNMYMTGIGVRRDYHQAAKYYNLAAQSGHILALYNLAQMHATGTGMMRSCTAAVELYKSVAERGRWGLLLAEAHNDHKEKRYSNALIKYLLLAELGYEAAQANAGFMLERGEIGWEVFEGWRKLGGPAGDGTDGKKEDLLDKDGKTLVEDRTPLTGNTLDLTSPQSMLSRALQQWSRSASQGYSQARVRLGDYYYYGWGTQTDYSSAATQYRLASEQQRNPQAMFNLAYMHEQGLGLKQDLHLAKRFYDMAAETSTDARVPVTLALMKLNVISTLHALKVFDMESGGFQIGLEAILEGFDISGNWDLYLLSGLVGILGILVWLRRPQQGG